MVPKAYVSWSSGKDSAYALYEAKRHGLVDVVGVLTTVNEEHDRVAMHGVRTKLLERQVSALGLPVLKVMIPGSCSNEIYEARMAEACATLKSDGVTNIVFGDLFLQDIRAYREERLAAIGIRPVFPLWGRDTTELAHEMIADGLDAYLVCIDPKRLDTSFAGRRFDKALVRDLPRGIDPCGENGEFHTVVVGGPMFSGSIPVSTGPVVERDGFVFADIWPVEPTK